MKPKLTDILSVALSTLGMDQVDWENYGRSRQGSIVIVKRLYCLLADELGYSHGEIGKVINIHRTSVIHHIKMLKDHCGIYPKCRELIEDAREQLKPYMKEIQLETEAYGYLARSYSGLLTISPAIPERMGGYWIAEGTKPYCNQSSFPQITWESDPVKVKIKVIIEDHEEM